MNEPITLDDLMPYRDHMSDEQLERYGEYLVDSMPSEPFTLLEMEELDAKRAARFNNHQDMQTQMASNAGKSLQS